MNRSDAKMIAEELHKFIRNDVRKAVTEMATAETEEYLNAKQAAVFLGWKLQTLYNRIHDIPHGKSSVSCPLKPSDSAPLKHSTMPP
ncbi:DNA-binding protein [Bacteroides uniformis]|uniref:DNA-binding protein n=1 Tax=Bacteroides uniformis TaxID=820 RepID=UPI00233F787D|nr:DNA-binding protein [Bacteroides uniformis]MDC1824520.1 DNA-binding protein [Bacteroides uniformis]MDC1828005.1 DNA-binding protein [Bacteroides uniformis]MDC1835550.1 DNA-binding protein [Bacteroides uniformis]